MQKQCLGVALQGNAEGGGGPLRPVQRNGLGVALHGGLRPCIAKRCNKQCRRGWGPCIAKQCNLVHCLAMQPKAPAPSLALLRTGGLRTPVRPAPSCIAKRCTALLRLGGLPPPFCIACDARVAFEPVHRSAEPL